MSLVKRLNVKSVKWRSVEQTATWEKFKDGFPTHMLSPVITCELPNDIDPFSSKNTVAFLVKDRMAISLSMCGYHIGNKEVIFESFESFKNEFKIDAFYL